jgi:hypothetical protein
MRDSKNMIMITIVSAVLVFSFVILAPMAHAASVVRSCDNSKSCVLNYSNGTQSVFLSNHKLQCIKAGMMIAVDKLFPQEGDELIAAAGNVTADCLTGAAK